VYFHAQLSCASGSRLDSNGPLSPFLYIPPFLERSQLSAVSMTSISVETKYFPSSGASSPALALQVTCLVDSYMLWIGVTEEVEENASRAILQGHLGKDWAVSMPPWKVRNSRNEGIGWFQQGNFISALRHQTLPATGSQLLRSSSSDMALSIAKRLGEH
jgi:hypothetical protein